MRIKKLHQWDVSYAEARELQSALCEKIKLTPLKRTPRLIAGLDCAFSKDDKRICAVIIALKFPSMEIIETQQAVLKVNFPYISGLLSFREAPVCIKAAEKLEATPDVFIIDGQGIAHPRRLGLAAHLGLFLNGPTIGCAKSRLIGKFSDVGPDKGSFSHLTDKEEVIGAVLRTRTNVKPVFVSPGNNCSLDDAIRITLQCAIRYRLPEPTRLAHGMVSKLRTNI